MADANPVQANPQEEPETTKRHGKTRGVRVRGKDAGTKPSQRHVSRTSLTGVSREHHVIGGARKSPSESREEEQQWFSRYGL